MLGRIHPVKVVRVVMVILMVVTVDRFVLYNVKKPVILVQKRGMFEAPSVRNNKTNLVIFQQNVSVEGKESLSASIFKNRKLIVWSNDFHIGPIQDLKHLLQPLGVKFIDKSLSKHCRLTRTCARGLKVVNRGNGIKLPREVIPQFYQAYKDDPEMATVDAFVCFHPSSMCELFMPFNKSILVIASTRYEMGRMPPDRWKEWNKNLLKISQDPKNVVAANNLYDAEYIKYFTGFKARVLASYCGYINEVYSPVMSGFLLAPVHKSSFQKKIMAEFNMSRNKIGSKVALIPLRQKYHRYKYSDLTAHEGIVYVPYQVSVMSLFEQYRMNIPLFFPSRDLLAQWQLKYHVMKERTWAMVFHKTPSKSAIVGLANLPDPNNEKQLEAIKYWIQFSDFYQWPYITYYNSTDDLVRQMERVNLKEISEKMKEFNAKLKKDLLHTWADILLNVAKYSKNYSK